MKGGQKGRNWLKAGISAVITSLVQLKKGDQIG
jgi:hypothetical protein